MSKPKTWVEVQVAGQVTKQPMVPNSGQQWAALNLDHDQDDWACELTINETQVQFGYSGYFAITGVTVNGDTVAATEGNEEPARNALYRASVGDTVRLTLEGYVCDEGPESSRLALNYMGDIGDDDGMSFIDGPHTILSTKVTAVDIAKLASLENNPDSVVRRRFANR